MPIDQSQPQVPSASLQTDDSAGANHAVLSLDRLLSGPLLSLIQAQIQAGKAYQDFLLGLCVQDGKAVAIEFDYDETQVNGQGQVSGRQTRTIRLPLMAAISHPCFAIENGTIDLTVELSQSSDQSETGQRDGSVDGGAGWGPVKVQMSGRVTHQNEQTRKTDTRAKCEIHVAFQRQPPSEALMRVIDMLTDATVKAIPAPSLPPSD